MKINSDLKHQLIKVLQSEDLFQKIEGLLKGFSPVELLNDKDCRFDGFFCSKSEENNSTNILYSDSIKSICGYSNEELLKIPGGLISLLTGDNRENIKRKYLQILNGEEKEDRSLLYSILTKDEKVVWIYESFNVTFNENNELRFFQSIGKNINEEVYKIESLTKEVEDSKLLIWQRDKFINIISHDLRSPFTSLLGFSEILINEPGIPTEERLEYLHFIHDASKTQLQFINNLLDWARLQTGKIKIELKRINLKDTVSNCVSLLTHSAISKNIDIRVNISEDLFVSADERLIGSTLSNLIGNAIKFSETGKPVDVYADRYKEGMVEIVVKDEGIGISEEDNTKVFKIEEKFILKGTAGEKGSGMGLILAKEIIKKHGGEIWFYSKENEGSEFHFTLNEAKNIILIIEDEPEIRKIYHYAFSKLLSNYEIIEAGNGYEAMSNVFNQLPSLVITDHDMPLMSGTQLIEAIRKKDKKNSVPIVVISAKLTPEISSVYQKLGVKYLLPKPIDMNELAKIIKLCLIKY
ncbi:MAG: hypothetical protein CO129_06895 [Ignavibacteriales bacterium CG_4_9_14_3_um_filter_34_10]|nr:MAG: hypothetical protein CO129_06895 [Ignavibacteriales bacterium CG_4_9_14_3_um_filter_34_10]